jgi:nicotinamidase-related amidase
MNDDLRRLLPRVDLTRRGFVVTTLAAGVALAARPVSADVTNKLSFDPKTTALLVMDFQTLIVEGFATDSQALLGRTAALLDAARPAGVMVVYVVVGFRAGYPEISPRNPLFDAVKASGRFVAGGEGTEIHRAVAPKPGEVVVTKHRVGAFMGTDLEMILKAHGVETLILAGVATSGVVLSTVRHAADADYGLVVVSDCCSDRDEEVHRVLLEKVLAKQASVATAADVTRAFGAAR